MWEELTIEKWPLDMPRAWKTWKSWKICAEINKYETSLNLDEWFQII
jgi:hypothetical protein